MYVRLNMRQYVLALYWLAVCTFIVPAAKADPLTDPIASPYAARRLAEIPPAHILANPYLVSASGWNVGLIQTNAGLVLIDGTMPQGVAGIDAHIRDLGVKITDVKYILTTKPHFDHTGGLAALAHGSGGVVMARAPTATVLRNGKSGADDPQTGDLPDFPAISPVVRIEDGGILKLGDVTFTAWATPGHTPGSTSWSWQSCEAQRCLNAGFAASINPVAADRHSFANPSHQNVLQAYYRTLKKLAALPCDVLLTARPEHSGGDLKRRSPWAPGSKKPIYRPECLCRLCREV